MNSPTSPSLGSYSSYNPYDLLRIYTYYRTLLGSVLLLMFQLEVATKAIGSDNPVLFSYTSLAYTLLNFIALAMMWRVKYLPSQRKLFGTLLIDVIAISLMMHASGGSLSGLGYLLLVSIAAGSIMLRERIATFLAAITTIAVITEGIYRFFVFSFDNKILFASASLSTLVFFTSLVFQYLTRKIRLSNEEAQRQASHAEHLQKLAQLIIERMRTGILVFNKDNEIELCNQSALNLLGLERIEETQSLKKIPELHNDTEVKINFAYLEPEKANETLIFLEDVRALTQQAQQLKLASLGRLTASIAHEVRNPLGAISHASQLLGESEELSAGDQRLLDIINNHSKRVNQIIENILQLSRRRAANPERINLQQWLPEFIKEYKATKGPQHSFSLALREYKLPPSELQHEYDDILGNHFDAKFDLSQLQQVLTNICDNGLRYSCPPPGHEDLRLEIGCDHYQQPFIRVVDYGPGISEENAKHLFEPFFTTENTGSGLGLYICKELCEANQALINYQRTDANESCFHIQLAHPDKAH
jgi:two-component system, NtrC family, sensor histidine kinase PilS